MSSETREALLASLPPGVREMLADDVVALFDATASTIDDSAIAAVDTLDADSTPLTCGSDRLRRWESDLGIASTRTALFGTVSARRAAVISRLREYGPPTVAMLQSVLAPLLDYPDPTTLTILEPARADVRLANTYYGVLGNATMSMISPGIWQFYVSDGGRCAGIPAVDIKITTVLENTDTVVALQSPDGTYYQVYSKLRSATGTNRVYFPEAQAVTAIMGAWRVYVYLTGANTGTMDDAQLFVEGVDRDGGRASGIFEWAAVYEPDKSNGSPDWPSAVAAAGRVGMATRRGGVVHIADAGVGLAAGDYAMIPNDNAVPSEFVPGA